LARLGSDKIFIGLMPPRYYVTQTVATMPWSKAHSEINCWLGTIRTDLQPVLATTLVTAARMAVVGIDTVIRYP